MMTSSKLNSILRHSMMAFTLALAVSAGGLSVEARKAHHERADYTAAQRARMLEEARKLCRKKYGSTSTVYRLDYHKWAVTCTEH